MHLLPCVVKTHGFYEGIGHATSDHGAETVFRQAARLYAEQPFEVHRKLIRLDGHTVEAFVPERPR